eukprot:364876-Chlamydomonas_euryale.AAC.2
MPQRFKADARHMHWHTLFKLTRIDCLRLVLPTCIGQVAQQKVASATPASIRLQPAGGPARHAVTMND